MSVTKPYKATHATRKCNPTMFDIQSSWQQSSTNENHTHLPDIVIPPGSMMLWKQNSCPIQCITCCMFISLKKPILILYKDLPAVFQQWRRSPSVDKRHRLDTKLTSSKITIYFLILPDHLLLQNFIVQYTCNSLVSKLAIKFTLVVI